METWAACQHALKRKPGCGQDVSALGDRAPTQVSGERFLS